MDNTFKKITCEELKMNSFTSIGKQWMLITAGDENGYNTMTASWGGMGIMWNKNVAFAFIRPQRYTLEFVDNSEYFTLCFFPEEYRPALTVCGTKSGRDIDKAKETGLTPCFDLSAPYFQQASTVLVCRKMYGQYFDEKSVIDESVKANYANNDYHKMFIAEIMEVYTK